MNAPKNKRFSGSVAFFAIATSLGCFQDEQVYDEDPNYAAARVAFEANHAALEQQLDSDPDNEEILYKLASGYWWLASDFHTAQSLYERLLTLNPESLSAHFDLAQLLNARGRYAASIRHFEAFINENPNDSEPVRYARSNIEEFERVNSKPSATKEWTEQDGSAVNSLNIKFIKVPAGEFTMGSANGESDCDHEHNVALDSYWISEHEVTAGQFEQFLHDTEHQVRFSPVNEFARTKEHAAVFVSWNSAVAFTKWLSYREGRVYRLPSEAEWEFAARGKDGRTNPWGNEKADPQRHGNLDRFSRILSQGKKPTVEPVGQFPTGVSAFGLHDMAGNASEWCLDYYDPAFYTRSPRNNPFGPSNPAVLERVLRGDSWRIKPSKLHAVQRDKWDAVTEYDCFGFRVVCEIHEE